MSKVYIDSPNLNSGCIIYLNDSISAVNKVLNYFDYFDIPYDFKKRSTLKDVESTLRSVKKELDYVKDWIVDSNSNYNTLINNLKSQASDLPSYQIKQRNNII